MSYLRKYAKPRAATKKKQYGTRLTEDEGKEFEAYCEELNLKPAEAIRYLILEELDRKQKQTITGDNKRDQLLSPVNTEKTNDIDLSTNAINKIPVGAVAAGMGITIIPELMAKNIGHLQLFALPITNFGRKRSISIATRSRKLGLQLYEFISTSVESSSTK